MSNKENPFYCDKMKNCHEFKVPHPSFNSNLFHGIADEENNILPQKKTRKIPKIPFKVLDAP